MAPPPPPEVPVDFRPPSDFNFASQSGPSCSFNSGFPSSSSKARPKPKPRLVKQRKSSKSSQPGPGTGLGLGSGSVDLGFGNPFSNCCSSSEFDKSGFVFGGLNSSNGSSNVVDCSGDGELGFGYGDVDRNRESNGVAFRFGGVDEGFNGGSSENGGDFEVVDKLNKLNIDGGVKGACRGEEDGGGGLDDEGLSKGGDRVFVFGTGGVSSDGCGESSECLESDGGVRSLKRDEEGGVRNGDNVFVFGNSAEFCKPDDCGFQSAAESEGAKVNEDVPLPSFLFSSLDDEVGTAKSDGCSLSNEMNEFQGFDSPLPFSANFNLGVDKKLETSVRNRGVRDRHLKKTKGKSKLSKNVKPQPAQTPVSSEGVTHSQEVPESYSPMDFSPYENTAENVAPPSAPPPTCGNSSSVPTEPQPDVTSTENSKINDHGGDANPFSIGSNTTSSENLLSSLRRVQRRKYRMKPASVSRSSSRVQGFSYGSTPISKSQAMGGNAFASASKDKQNSEAGDELGCDAYSAAEKACEKWRRRGNEAYEQGELSNAEEFYTWGVNCVPLDNALDVGFGPLVRCYSNRAATRMALGRVREAIQDCLMAVKYDPSFHRAQIRAANCYLQLGEVEEAIQCFDKCMGSDHVVCLDRQVIISASEGIQKCQKVIECTSRSAELLKLRTAEDATDAVQYITEAMSISIHSEKLLELKAQALCTLSRHEEVITLCQKTLDFAEKNFTNTIPGCQKVDGSLSNARLWRYRTLAKCQFHRGNLQAALDLLENQELRNKTQELSEIAVTIHELLKQKNAGNTAFHSGKHLEAIEHYTSAIYNSMESRPFSAICLCNRAAAYQALGQITDAIADCSLAMALDGNYAKAISRRATLHEMIRDYKQAAADLQNLLTYQRQYLETSKHSGSGKGKEFREVQQRLSVMEEESKKDTPLDLYLILGSKKGDSVAEIKKAYRKAALKHHPDKAAQSLVKSGEGGEEGRHWKDIAELVHKDSDRLFKIIGEAYAVLSDPTKREEYDHDEDLRKILKENNNIRTNARRNSEHYSQGYPFERSSSRRYWQDSYRTYGYSQRR